MKNDVLLPGITAIAIHALVFSAPLPKIMSNNIGVHLNEPISICIVNSKKSVAPASAVKAATEAADKHPVPAIKNIAAEPEQHKTTIVEYEPAREAVPELFKPDLVDHISKDSKEETLNSTPVEKASINEEVFNGVRESTAASQGTTKTQYGTVYARPRYKENPLPHYPEVARRKGYEGRALIRVRVLENGRAGDVELEDSTGFKILDAAALRSVRGLKFEPGKINGKKIEQWIKVPIKFELK